MKSLKIFGFLAVLALIASSNGCKKANPEPQNECIEGVVLTDSSGRIFERPDSMGPCHPVVQIKNKSIGENWFGFSNCVTVRNLERKHLILGKKIYFKDFTREDVGGCLAIFLFPPTTYIKPSVISDDCKTLK